MPSPCSRLLAAVALVALPACTEIAAPETGRSDLERPNAQLARATSWKSTEDFQFAVPIYLPCLDEEVVWSGTVRYSDHFVLRPDGRLHLNGQAALLPGSTLVGESGTWHPAQIISNYIYDDFLVAPGESNVRVVERVTWHHASSGAIMDVWFNVQYVIDGQGRMRREVFEGHTCALR